MNASATPRVVVIGLDMGDGALIQHWASVGVLPNLRNAINEGSWFNLESPAQMLHGSGWPSFATGRLPGKHGIYFPLQPKAGHRQAQAVTADQFGASSFWSLADRHGRRCLVYDVPATFPEAGFKGRAIFEWGTWVRYGQRVAQPQTLLANLQARFGTYPLGMDATQLGLGRPSRATLQEKLPLSVAYKRESLQWLMEQGEWDLTVAVFGETRSAAHYLWPVGARDAVSTEANRFRPIHSVYVAVDRAIGAIRAALLPNTVLMIVSAGGVQPNYAGWHLLPAVLDKLGYSSAAGGRPAARKGKAKQISFFDAIRNRLSERLQPQAGRASMRAFALPTDLEGCIRINLQGREPHGVVAPGAEYVALCQELRMSLSGLVNPATGKSAVKKVWLRDEIFPGERRDQLPDVVVGWSDEAPIAALALPGVGIIEGPSPDPRTGTHAGAGFLIACGTGFPAGRKASAHLVQVAPTVLRCLGLEEDPHLDGVPLVADLRKLT